MKIFPYRMARKPSLLQFLIWTSSIPIAISRNVGLGGDIASIVPSCAQSCLLSFITSNYPTIDCGTDFTLPCLCPAQSLSGFTVGEAALQCLFGYIQLGQCDEQDGDGAAPARVLHMCSGQDNALPNTHATLTATLVIPPSGAPSLLAPPTSSKTTLLTSSTSTSTRTTLRTSTRTPSITTTPTPQATTSMAVTSFPNSSPTTTSLTTSLTASSTTSSTSSATTSSAISSATSTPTSEPSPTTRLAPAQIAGISVGVAGAIAIAAGAIILARCLRRRKYPDADSEKAYLQNNDSTGGFDSFGSRNSHIFHISPPLFRTSQYPSDLVPRPAPPPPQAVQPEPPMQSNNIDRDTIGLAISRPRSLIPPRPSPKIYSPAMSTPRIVEAPLERKPSKLLPPRPALTLNIPSNAVTPSAPSSQGPLTKDRASTLTNMTAFADLDLEAAEGEQTWRPPPTDPLSATTLYVADKYGNWVLSNNHRRSQVAQIVEAAELDTYTPLTKSPAEKREEAAKMAAAISAATTLPRAPQPAFLSQDPTNWTYSQSSSLYSQASSGRQSGRRNSGRNSGSRSRKSGSGLLINRSDSKASATTIQTSSTGGKEDGFPYENDVARLSQLLPVKEAPSPATGRSQVTYPKIPGRLDGATIRFVPPPKRPDFASSRFEQLSPTLGVGNPVEGSPSAYPRPLNPRRNDRQFTPMERTGSGFTPEPPELPNVEVFPIQDDDRSDEVPRPGPYSRFNFVPPPPAEPYRYMDPQQRDPFSTPSPQYGPTFTPSPPSTQKRSLTPPQPKIMDRGRPQVASQRVESGTSFQTVSSTTSSLLAKRIGNDRAAALALDPNGKKAQKWRRQGNDGGLLSPDAILLGSPRGTLPQTPIWQPKLTPTRRGGDLYLNVQ